MVLASNEWLNNCEDEQKPATTTTTTTTTVNNTVTTAAAGVATTTTTTPPPLPLSQPPTAIPNTNNSQNTADILSNITIAIGADSNSLRRLDAAPPFDIMAENPLKDVTLKSDGVTSDELEMDSNLAASAAITEGLADTLPLTAELTNNNRELLLHNSLNSCDTLTDATTAEFVSLTSNILNSNPCPLGVPNNANNESDNNSNANSNSSTLQSALVRQMNKSTPPPPQPPAGVALGGIVAPAPLSNPITPQQLSNALQSVMNATNNANANNSSAVNMTNMPNNFLSTLNMEIGTSALLLQQTAKQITSALRSGMPDSNSQSNLSTGSSNGLQTGLSIDCVEPDPNGQAKIVLICESNSHPFQTRTIHLTPNIECKVGRLIAKSKASESNAIFDCKVLSRNHAVLWYSDDGKFWVKDTKSSNGTFINENKLGNEPAELHFGDIVKFGVDVLENSRKEVHGCIIAFVKLYLPDGREAISIGGGTQRSQYSGEGRISFDEMHRLNLYMQEVSQREKALKSKLFNIQNVLDATRKNSALCWQSLIAEDQLLHRIHSLEKKLQIMEKNVPESVLRNEILKLLDDKNSYQLTAKEALRKVYQERAEAMQMVTKMESAYITSDNECKLLRDQIMNTKQSLLDATTRLQRLEADFNEYKDETERKQQEIKDQEEQRAIELMDRLEQREQECEKLRRRIAELMQQNNEKYIEDERKQTLQALAKLDAALVDMGFSDDGNDDEVDEGDDVGGVEDVNEIDMEQLQNYSYGSLKALRKKKKMELNGEMRGDREIKCEEDSVSSGGGSEKEKSSVSSTTHKESPPGEPGTKSSPSKYQENKKSTIFKWLQNSDLTKKEGSLDIMNAICNESDSSDEADMNDDLVSMPKESTTAGDASMPELAERLKRMEQLLEQLSTEMSQEADENNGEKKSAQKVYVLLMKSATLLHGTYTDMCAQLKQQKQEALKAEKENEKLKRQQEANAESDIESFSDATSDRSVGSQRTVLDTSEADGGEPQPTAVANDKLKSELRMYQEQVAALNAKLEQVETDSNHMCEMLQIEADAYKDKVEEMTRLLHTMKQEKHTTASGAETTTSQTMGLTPRETELSHTESSTQIQTEAAAIDERTAQSTTFDEQLRDDLLVLNSNELQREEELIAYKERLDQVQHDNAELRHQIEALSQPTNEEKITQLMLFRPMAVGVVLMAVIFYFMHFYWQG